MAEETRLGEKRRPRILLIKPVLPYPPDRDTRMLSFRLICALKDRFDVTVLSKILSPAETPLAEALEQWCKRVDTVLAPHRRSALHRIAFRMFYFLTSTIARQSMKSLYDCPGALLRAAKRLPRENFDLILIEYWQLQKMARLFPQAKVVLLTHDVDMHVNRQVALFERNLISKIRAVRRWIVEQREEIQAYRAFRKILTLTERDRQAVRKIAGSQATVEILPFGLDPEFYARPGGDRHDREVLFVGDMGMAFDRDALDVFVRRICPRIDHLEDLTITVVGGALPKPLAYISADERVDIIGKVGDIRPFLYRAGCLVVPLRFGGGLRIRILEAMFAGLPVICSSVAVAGMPFEREQDFLGAETPEEFAAQIERLLGDRALAESLAASALRKVSDSFGAQAQAERTEELFKNLINTG
ncbi:MAG: glycosyltransferase [Candidatus Latescibacteria bacterium]|nr:glycosyltransferase [Candidatus Latescibacterota bacterium]NIM20883.1 glycosyltransferase [Candidatus Latescibacterota bacterium]NIM65018.1 glycosyltransferase [Candidatus Latescibacterota bacterium]NIO01533.1 glycosyltransferase [Candidatus Latescibacterota bacterium]NIO28050.1 glycosyltransferase [Candidatus Latescibacterota bacterium]